MKLYRLHKTYDCGVSCGYEYFASKKEAEKSLREHMEVNPREDKEANEIVAIEVAPNKTGILAALNQYADHPDNG